MLWWHHFTQHPKNSWMFVYTSLTFHNTQHKSLLHLQKKIWKGHFCWNILSFCIGTISFLYCHICGILLLAKHIIVTDFCHHCLFSWRFFKLFEVETLSLNFLHCYLFQDCSLRPTSVCKKHGHGTNSNFRFCFHWCLLFIILARVGK